MLNKDIKAGGKELRANKVAALLDFVKAAIENTITGNTIVENTANIEARNANDTAGNPKIPVQPITTRHIEEIE